MGTARPWGSHSTLDSAGTQLMVGVFPFHVRKVTATSDSESALDGRPLRTGLAQTLIELGE